MRESVESVGSNLGSLLTLFAMLMTTPAVVAAFWGEWYAIPGVLAAAAITGLSGRLLDRSLDPGGSQEVYGIATAAVGWLLAGLYGSLPILFVAWTIAADPGWLATPRQSPTDAALASPINATFEGVSGITGTGLTMTIAADDLPRTIQWWRSAMQWVGGIGVVVLAASIALTAERDAFTSLYEERGAVTSLRSNTRETIKLVWWIFCLFTFVAVVVFWLAGMPIWHAINHAMTGVSTGGFTVASEGIGGYSSLAIEAAIVPFMLVGAISFAVHYYLLQGDVALLRTDAQTRWLLALAALGSLAVALALSRTDAPLEAVRHGGFQFVSGLTATGFQTDPGVGSRWPTAGRLVVAGAMVIGGAAGSTTGGIKLIRAISLTKGALSLTTTTDDESGESGLQVEQSQTDATAGQTASPLEQAAAVGTLWIAALFAVVLVSVLALPTGEGGYRLGEVLFEAASAQGNVGLTAGLTGPSMPTAVKLAFVASMWLGRLEIVPVVVTGRLLLGRIDR